VYQVRVYKDYKDAKKDKCYNAIKSSSKFTCLKYGETLVKEKGGEFNAKVLNEKGYIIAKTSNSVVTFNYFLQPEKSAIMSALRAITDKDRFTLKMGDVNNVPSIVVSNREEALNASQLSVLGSILNTIREYSGCASIEKIQVVAARDKIRNLEWHESSTEEGSIVVTYGMH